MSGKMPDFEHQSRLAVFAMLDETNCTEVKIRLPDALLNSYRRSGYDGELSDVLVAAALCSPSTMIKAQQDKELERLTDNYRGAVRGALVRCLEAEMRRRAP